MTILPQLKQDVLEAAAAHLPQTEVEQELVSSRPRRVVRSPRRGPFFPAVMALVAAAVVALVVLVGLSTSPLPAYALIRNADRTVTVTVHDLAAATPQVNAEFARLGIDWAVIPVTRGCAQRATIVFSPPTRSLKTSVTLTPGRKYLLPGWHGVLVAKQLSDGKVGLGLAVVHGRLPSCLPSASSHASPPAGRVSALVASPPSTGRQAGLLAEQALIAFKTSNK
jgi:hypothetical protein